MAWKIADYVPLYSANILPVIPAGAPISPHSKIPASSAGKVPGLLGEDGWHGIPWRTMEPVSLKQAQRWDRFCAGLGFRLTPDFVCVDLDITWGPDCLKARALVTTMIGDVPLRIVDHPEHVKALFFLRVDSPVRNSDLTFVQSDGKKGKIQLLADGRYFNVHGVHPGRLKPYRWPNVDPVHVLPPIVPMQKVIELMRTLRETFKAGPDLQSYSRSDNLPPETCTMEEAQALLELIPNDDFFVSYDRFVAMGAAIFGASAGADWGRQLWLDWCDQVTQGDPDKPEAFWNSMREPRVGAEMLHRWAQSRQPSLLAQRDFAEDLDGKTVKEVVADMTVADDFLNNWFLVGGSTFYRMPELTPYSVNAFALETSSQAGRIRRHFGAKGALPEIYVRYRRHTLDNTIFMPGGERVIGRSLNTWTAPPRPWEGRPLDRPAIDVYLDLLRFVMGDELPAERWLKWHAFMLQHPSIPPGWHWMLLGSQGIGKDLILRPFAAAHGVHFQQIDAKILARAYNSYSEKRLVNISEMRERPSADLYTGLKGLTAGTEMVLIHPKGRSEYMARNTMGMVIFSNENHPLRIAAEDRRFYVVENLSAVKRSPEYYAATVDVLDRHGGEIAEHCWRMKLTDDDMRLLRGNAPASAAKAIVSEIGWQREILEIIGEVESETPPDRYLPIATTSDIRKWLNDRRIPDRELPHHIDFVEGLHVIGLRPLVPAVENPKRPGVIQGHRLWRFARKWRDTHGVEWDVENISPQRLAKLYTEHKMPGPDLHAVGEEDEI
jgi:hypothetical protein